MRLRTGTTTHYAPICATRLAARTARMADRAGGRQREPRSHHGHLAPELGREDRLRDEGVDAPYDIHHLGHAEAYGHAAERVSVKLADLRPRRQELDRIARAGRHGGVE